MNGNSTPPSPHGAWWFAWVVATVIIPATAWSLMLAMPEQSRMPALYIVSGAALILHLAASIKLDRRGTGLISVLLVFGGWLLMIVSLFVGCLALVRHWP